MNKLLKNIFICIGGIFIWTKEIILSILILTGLNVFAIAVGIVVLWIMDFGIFRFIGLILCWPLGFIYGWNWLLS